MRRLASLTISPREFFWVADSALAVCTLIVFTGAAVRLTGSGPRLPGLAALHGRAAHARAATHSLIEFGNRMLTGVVGLPCLLAAMLAWRRRPFRRDLALIALLLPLGVLGQAVLGGLTVSTASRPAG